MYCSFIWQSANTAHSSARGATGAAVVNLLRDMFSGSVLFYILSTRAVIYHATSHGVSKSLRIHSMEFKPPATVLFNTDNTAEIWHRWEQQFRIYLEAAELATKPPKTQVAVLLHCAGLEAQDVFTNVVFANIVDDEDANWEHVLKKF